MKQGAADEAFARQDWPKAYLALVAEAQESNLGATRLEKLGLVAQLLGRDEEGDQAWEQAHQAYLGADEVASAARCAFWLGMASMERGQMAHASGWLGRAQRLLKESAVDCPEQGYVQVPQALQLLEAGDIQGAREIFWSVQAFGKRFKDTDLMTLGLLGDGHALIKNGDISSGVARHDEAMISVLANEVSPLVAGIVYCAVIEACQGIFDLRRAQEWTDALTRWCDRQPGLIPFKGKCQVYRSELMQLQGDWQGALEAAKEAERRLIGPPASPVVGDAYYQQGELHRLRGAVADADMAYRLAEEWGRRPEPGRALLRLGQGKTAAAATAIRHALNETSEKGARALLLPAAVEILAVERDEAGCKDAVEELVRLSESFESAWLGAAAALAKGIYELVLGDPSNAAAELRVALSGWQSLDTPYEVARTRLLLSEAARSLGDQETAEAQRDAASKELKRLGITSAPGLAGGRLYHEDDGFGLTPRETEILRLLARGMTNRAIATSLTISERTVANHVGNILGKLGLSSRAAATAYAYEHGLIK